MSKEILDPWDVDLIKLFKKNFPRRFEYVNGLFGGADPITVEIKAIDRKTKENWAIIDCKHKPRNNIKKIKEAINKNLDNLFDIPISNNSGKFVIAEMTIEYDDQTRQTTVSLDKISEFTLSDKEYADRITYYLEQQINMVKAMQDSLPAKIETLKKQIAELESEYKQIPSQIEKLNNVIEEMNKADKAADRIKIAKAYIGK